MMPHRPKAMNCPICGHKGKTVKAMTIESLLTQDALEGLSSKEGFRFCPSVGCEVSYFHLESGRRFGLEDVKVRIGQKVSEAPRPVCYCFGHSVEDIEAEVARTGTSKIPDAITEKCRSGLDRCAETNPQGACCLGNVRRALKVAQEKFDSAVTTNSRPLLDCCATESTETKSQNIPTNRNGLWATGGALCAAGLSSACCWLPLLLLALGISATGLASFFETYRPLLLGATGVLLATGFYRVYFRKECCLPNQTCAIPDPRFKRLSKSMLWIATVVVCAFAFFPNILGILLDKGSDHQATVTWDSPSHLYQIDSMTCTSCATNLQSQPPNTSPHAK